jgi:hypothetical protein
MTDRLRHVLLENLRPLYYGLCFCCVAGANEWIACTRTGRPRPSGRMRFLLPSVAAYFVGQINRLRAVLLSNLPITWPLGQQEQTSHPCRLPPTYKF